MKDISYLKESGIDIDGALQLLGTVEMYNDTLNEFLKGIDEKFNNIKVYKDNNDFVNYSILVHSLKSDSKYLGFTKLAMLAYNHEIKSKENDIVYVNSYFMDLENELHKAFEVITNERDRKIMYYRLKNLTVMEIGEMLNITHQYVSARIKQIRKKLKESNVFQEILVWN